MVCIHTKNQNQQVFYPLVLLEISVRHENKRVKVPLILIFSVNTNHESVAYRSFSPSKFEARGARKVTTGINVNLVKLMSQALVGNVSLVRSTPLHAGVDSYGNSCQVESWLGKTPGCGDTLLCNLQII